MTGESAAASRRPSRCATTTAIAASSMPGTMCPSYRVTGDEQHLTRGRANTLRLALSGQLGAGALRRETMHDDARPVRGCKGCKRECPTGVDMAKMKIEFLHHYHARARPAAARPSDRASAALRAVGAPLAPLLNLRDRIPAAGPAVRASGSGFRAQPNAAAWRTATLLARSSQPAADVRDDGREVVSVRGHLQQLFRARESARGGRGAAGGRLRRANRARGRRRPPLCCGRTFLAAGMVDEARREARRVLRSAPFAARGVRDRRARAVLPVHLQRRVLDRCCRARDAASLARQSFLLEEFVAREHNAGRWRPAFGAAPRARAATWPLPPESLRRDDGGRTNLTARAWSADRNVVSSCCGMAGAFGYEAEHYDVSMKMGKPACSPKYVRPNAIRWSSLTARAAGTKFADGTGRQALHVAQVLRSALKAAPDKFIALR